MTKLQKFMLEISQPKEEQPKETRSGLPDYAVMSPLEKNAIDNLKKAVEEAIRVFSRYE